MCDLKEMMVNVGANHVICFQRMWFKKLAERKFCVCVGESFSFQIPFFIRSSLLSCCPKVNLTLHAADSSGHSSH